MRGQLDAFAVLLAKGAVAASDASAHAFADAAMDVVAAREALTPAGVAATHGSVTASGTSSPAVGVAAKSVVTDVFSADMVAEGAKAAEDVVMDSVVVAAEKTATEAAVDAVTTAVGAVLSAKLAAGISDSVAQAALNA